MRNILFFLTLLFILFPNKLGAVSINRVLQFGNIGEDVRQLQKFLNSSADTKVADAGPGSPSNETNYFGISTKNAVMKFQSKYASEILIPAGLSAPTGVFGALSLNKLNSLESNKIELKTDSLQPISLSSSPETESFFSRFFVLPLKVFALSKYSAKPGENVRIFGQGFLAKDNIIHIGPNYSVTGVSGDKGIELIFNIPESVPSGKYNIWVSNKNGSTFNASYGDYFTISNQEILLPIIDSIIPAKIKYIDLAKIEIIVSAKNVSDSSQITTSLGKPSVVRRENGNFYFYLDKASDFNFLSRSVGYLKGVEVPVYIYVLSGFDRNQMPGVLYVQF